MTMTRDEAIEKVRLRLKAANGAGEICPALFVECCLALGILKLDEPRSRRDRFKLALADGFREGSMGFETALIAYDESQK